MATPVNSGVRGSGKRSLEKNSMGELSTTTTSASSGEKVTPDPKQIRVNPLSSPLTARELFAGEPSGSGIPTNSASVPDDTHVNTAAGWADIMFLLLVGVFMVYYFLAIIYLCMFVHYQPNVTC